MKRSISHNRLFATVETFFQEYLQRTCGASPRTLSTYGEALRMFFEYAEKARGIPIDRLQFTDLDAELVVDYLEHLERDRHNSTSTRNNRLAALRSFFAHALRRCPDHGGRLARITALHSKRYTRKPPAHLEPEAIQKLLHAADRSNTKGRRTFALLLFLYNTGARVSEAAALRFTDLMPGPAPTVRLHGKGGRDRFCALWPATLIALNSQHPAGHPSADAPVFQNARGGPISRHGIYYILTHHATKAHTSNPAVPAKIWPHLFRHSCGVALLEAGVDLTVIRDQLGHASVATTGRYANSSLKLKEQALKAFWAAAGISPPKQSPWARAPRLSEFLRSC